MKELERHKKCREVLIRHGYNRLHQVAPKKLVHNFTLDFWAGPAGVIIVQNWEDGGCSTYWSQGLGGTWEEMEAALNANCDPSKAKLLEAAKPFKQYGEELKTGRDESIPVLCGNGVACYPLTFRKLAEAFNYAEKFGK